MMVLDEVEPLARAELAGRLADFANPPRRTLLQLAEDEQIKVAEPILARSPAIEEADLERIARHQSQEHLAAIAGRPNLSERVTDVLVDRGDDRVVHTVAGNHGARFSPKGFTTLADRASTNEELLHRLAARGDCRPRSLRGSRRSSAPPWKRGCARPAPTRTGPPSLASPRNREFVLADRLRAASKMARSLAVLVDHLDRGLISLDEAIIELSDVDATPDVAKLIADRVELRPDTVMRALCAPSDEPVTLLCRAAGVKVNGYSAVVRMRRRRRRGTDGSPAQLLEQYQQIPLDMAQRILRFLKVRETAEAV